MQNVIAINSAARQSIIVAQATSDETLLRGIADGNRNAMHTLYARHNVRVYRFILRIVRDSTMAEDLVSQVFLDVWRTARQFEGRSQVSTWLLSIARFKALTSLRQRRFEDIDQDDVREIADPPRDHKSRLLSRKIGGRGRADHWHPTEHREDADVLCPEAARRPAQMRRDRHPRRLSTSNIRCPKGQRSPTTAGRKKQLKQSVKPAGKVHLLQVS
jgi:RNA polymerase sigma factor (sigma-70 family)